LREPLVSGSTNRERRIAMHTQRNLLLTLAAASLLIATIAGAVGSHALSFADERALRSFSTAVEFQFFHGLGVIGVTLVGLEGRGGSLRAATAWLMLAGAVLFCGSIYAKALGAPGDITAVAPYGGVAFMLGWVLFAVSVWLRGLSERSSD
jgi:uncharacterized membrane protein YgdD (TMEM256/DUF423 family)